MPASVRQGWGNIQAVIPTVHAAGGVQAWTVAPDIGLAIQLPVSDRAVRLSYIHARAVFIGSAAGQVDYTPYRLMVIRGQVPPNVSLLQAGIDGLGVATQEIPTTQTGAGFDILDDWTYQNGLYAPAALKLPNGVASNSTSQLGGDDSSYLNGTKFEVHHRFGGGGPVVMPTGFLSILFLPMTGSAISAGGSTPNGDYSVFFSLTAWGRDDDRFQSDAMQTKSLPRYDFHLPRDEG